MKEETIDQIFFVEKYHASLPESYKPFWSQFGTSNSSFSKMRDKCVEFQQKYPHNKYRVVERTVKRKVVFE